MSVIDELSDQLDELSDNLSDLSDNTDQSISDVQDTLDDHANTLDDLNDRAGKLDFPLDPDTVDLIKSIFPSGTATLSGGSVSITNGSVSASSIIIVSYGQISGTPGALSCVASTGYFTISSTQLKSPAGTDNSQVNYIILS